MQWSLLQKFYSIIELSTNLNFASKSQKIIATFHHKPGLKLLILIFDTSKFSLSWR